MLIKHRLMAPEDDLGGGGGGGGEASDLGGNPSAGSDTPAPTMEDTARAAYRELMSAGESGEGEGGEPEPRHKSQPRVNGRFAKAEEGAPGEGEQQPQEGGEQPPTDEGQGDDPLQQQQQQQPKPHDTFPSTWKKELASEWAKLPESVREQIHKREADFHNGIKLYKDAAGFGAQMAQELAPYHDLMQRFGTTPQAVVRDIMGSLRTMALGDETSKAQVFLKLADQYGINLDTVLSLRQRAPDGTHVDLSPVLQRIEQVERRFQQADQERALQQQREDDARVNAFLNDPKNEFAREVIAEMQALLLGGKAETLQDAYEQALWLNPVTRQKLLQRQEDERRKREKAEAEAAKKAAAANVQRRGTPPTPPKPGTMEDTARSVYRRLMSS